MEIILIMLIPVLFHSFTQPSPRPIASLLLSAPSFMADIYNIGVPEQFQTLFGPRCPLFVLPPPFGPPSRPPHATLDCLRAFDKFIHIPSKISSLLPRELGHLDPPRPVTPSLAAT